MKKSILSLITGLVLCLVHGMLIMPQVQAQTAQDATKAYCIQTNWNVRGPLVFTNNFRALVFRSGAAGVANFYAVRGMRYDFYTSTPAPSNLQFARLDVYDSLGNIVATNTGRPPVGYDVALNFTATRSGNYRLFIVTSNCFVLQNDLDLYYRQFDPTPPTIMDFNPKFGGPGTRVIVNGSNMSTVTRALINGSVHFPNTVGNLGFDFQTNVSTPTGKIVAESANGNDTTRFPFIALPYNVCTGLFSSTTCSGPGIVQLRVGNATLPDTATNCNAINENHLAVDTRPVRFFRGQTYTVSFSTTTAAYAGFWLDRDRDGQYEQAEFVPLTVTAGRTRYSATISFAQNELVGEVMARIRTSASQADIYDDGGCDTQTNPGHAVDIILDVDQPACPSTPVLPLPASVTLCQGQTLTLKPGTPANGVYYVWSNSSNSDSLVVGTSGTYTVRSVAGSCTSAASNAVVVSVVSAPARPTVTAQNGVSVICGSTPVVLQTSFNQPTARFRWSNGDTTATISVTTPGTYTVQVGLANCFSTASTGFTVTAGTQAPRPTVQTGGGNAICRGGVLILTTPAAASYLWSTGATTRSITVNRGGRYWVRVSQAGTCFSDTSVNFVVRENPKPLPVRAVASGSTNICSGDSVRLSAPTGYSFYRWNNGATTREIFVKNAGRYWVSVSQNGLCYSDSLSGYQVSGVTVFPVGATANDSIYLLLDPSRTCPLPAVNAGASLATASTIRLHSGITLAAGPWQNTVATTTPAVEPQTRFTNQAGTWVKALLPRSYYGLQAADNATALNFVLNGDAAVGGWFAREGKVEPGCADFTVPLPVQNNIGASPYAVAVSVSPAPTRPTITALSDTTLCTGQSVVLQAPTGTGYLWSTGATTRTITVNTAGTYTVRMVLGNCTSATSRAVTVRVNPTPNAPIVTVTGATTFCAGDSAVLTLPAGNNYLWSDGSTATRRVVRNTGSLTVRQVLGSCTSAVSNPVAITVNPRPGVPTYTFANNVITMTSATSGLFIQWLLNGNPIPGANGSTYTITQAGSYSVRVTTAAGCANTSVATALTSLVGNAKVLNLTLVPNPTATVASLVGDVEEVKKLSVLAADGREVSALVRYDAQNHSLDCQELSAGLYMVVVQHAQGVQVLRLLKQ